MGRKRERERERERGRERKRAKKEKKEQVVLGLQGYVINANQDPNLSAPQQQQRMPPA
jgi:hypothetical protein